MPKVRALIRLLPVEQGGRTSPVLGSFRPNHNFFGPDDREMAVGVIDFPPGESLSPGEERLLDVQFVAWPDGVDFTPGRVWRIQEGAKLVGFGKVVGVS